MEKLLYDNMAAQAAADAKAKVCQKFVVATASFLGWIGTVTQQVLSVYCSGEPFNWCMQY